ncbi:hypothetical protein ACFLQ2_01450 [archaeon]
MAEIVDFKRGEEGRIFHARFHLGNTQFTPEAKEHITVLGKQELPSANPEVKKFVAEIRAKKPIARKALLELVASKGINGLAQELGLSAEELGELDEFFKEPNLFADLSIGGRHLIFTTKPKR